MARPSKLSPDQWKNVERRVLDGESIRSLAREFGVSEGAIRQRVSTQTTRVKNVAHKLAEAQTALAALPVPQQYAAVSLAEKLRNISSSLAAAAELGAATAHRLILGCFGILRPDQTATTHQFRVCGRGKLSVWHCAGGTRETPQRDG